jgi:DNA gyrase/topoisomerase IV subunit B
MASSQDYKYLSDIDHVRHRSDMYIGSIKNIKECRWLIKDTDEDTKEENIDKECEQKEVEYNPGLEQCILELIVNAADHVERCKAQKLDPVKKIKLSITNDSITIWNDGPGIILDEHPTACIPVPELIFGHLRTSSNYDDNQKKTWGGKNGIGAKAANIFSTKFIIDLQTNGKKYYQEFSNGMKNKTKAIIKSCSGKADYTSITYFPDFEAFGMKDFTTNDTIKLIEKRAYDLSAATGRNTEIYYNDEKIKIKDFADYMTLFIGKSPKVTYKTERWEVGFALCPFDSATQISFVNAICTDDGGSHVKHVLEPVIKKITDELQKKSKGVEIKSQYIKDNVIIFIKALIENPSFSSQLKRKLETKVSDFGSRCDVPDDIIKKVAKLGICDNVLEIAKAKGMKDAMKKIDGTKAGKMPAKLEDANWAGTSKAMECTLILTEGDSVSGDTPLTLRNTSGQIVIKNIEDLTGIFEIENGKEYGKSDYEIWTDSGWTKIKHVMRHETSKQMYRVLTNTGCVDVTEDHSLLDKNGCEITPGACKINKELLHSFPIISDSDGNSDDIDISPDEAWVMGLFFTNGNCKFKWELINADLNLLKKIYDILVKIYGDDIFSICTTEQQYKICLNEGLKNKHIVEKYKKLLYYKKWKYIDSLILNADREIREKFFNGYYVGLESSKVNINGKITAQSIYALCNSLGYQTSIDYDYKKSNIYTVCITKGPFKENPNLIKQIIKLPKEEEEQYVYDLETENHHFQAGIGQLIVHNSAKGLALNGIPSAGGRNKWGAFPLRGKFLNIRTATAEQLIKNEEIIAVNKILGLKEGLKDIKKLRYGKVMIFTDSDVDGAHIKGLLINYFTFNWPELVEQGLLECMITPLIKVFKGNKMIKQFYNSRDHKIWLEHDKPTDIREKYYKGLGTSTAAEAKEYFTDLESNRKKYAFKQKTDMPIIVRTFDKEYADQRKEWITAYLKDPQEVDYNKKEVQVDYFINRELVQFSVYDNERSIPSVIDGLKPSQRKILFGCLKKKLFLKNDGSGEIKVAQLSGYISEQAGYHHGEVSLQGTIIGMAQDFVGSNNLNLLLPIGNFGSRLQGGEDAASPRYIYTALAKEVKILFNETDNILLKYREDEGLKIEPDFYVPIVPMLLINGSNGIGTGWSTNIPCFNISIIIQNILKLLDDDDADLIEMNPYYKGFKGKIIKDTNNSWKTSGVVEFIDKHTVDITELPVGMWKQDFKEFLDKLLETDKIKSVAVDVDNENDKNDKKNKNDKTVNDVHYRIKLHETITREDIPKMISFFKLEKNINTTNMNAFDENGVINKYGSIEDILWTFFKYRLSFYQKRYDYLEKTLNEEITKISERLRFVLLVISDKIVVFKKKKSEIIEQLNYYKFNSLVHNFLLSMKLHQFTQEEVEDLQKELDVLKHDLKQLLSKTNKDLWKEDLMEYIKSTNMKI